MVSHVYNDYLAVGKYFIACIDNCQESAAVSGCRVDDNLALYRAELHRRIRRGRRNIKQQRRVVVINRRKHADEFACVDALGVLVYGAVRQERIPGRDLRAFLYALDILLVAAFQVERIGSGISISGQPAEVMFLIELISGGRIVITPAEGVRGRRLAGIGVGQHGR